MTERFPWNLWRDLDALYYDSGKAYFDSFEGFRRTGRPSAPRSRSM